MEALSKAEKANPAFQPKEMADPQPVNNSNDPLDEKTATDEMRSKTS